MCECSPREARTLFANMVCLSLKGPSTNIYRVGTYCTFGPQKDILCYFLDPLGSFFRTPPYALRESALVLSNLTVVRPSILVRLRRCEVAVVKGICIHMGPRMKREHHSL